MQLLVSIIYYVTFVFHFNEFNFLPQVSIIHSSSCVVQPHNITGFKWLNGLYIIKYLLSNSLHMDIVL